MRQRSDTIVGKVEKEDSKDGLCLDVHCSNQAILRAKF